MTAADPLPLLTALGWVLTLSGAVAAAVLSLVAWRRPAPVLTVLAAALLALTLLIAAVMPAAAPAVVTAVLTIAALVVAVAGGSPAVRIVLDRVAFDEEEGAHGGLLVAGRELLRGGEVIGLLERLSVAGAVIAGVPEALAVIIAIKGVGRFTELETSAVRERFIVGTLASWVWAAAAAGIVLLARS